jgi:hypothetical protein
MAVSLAIMALIVGLAWGMFSYHERINEARVPMEKLSFLVKHGIREATDKRASSFITFTEAEMTLVTPKGGHETVPLPEGLLVFLKTWRTPEWTPATGQVWHISPLGVAEPLQARFLLRDEVYEATYHPLTGSINDEGWD